MVEWVGDVPQVVSAVISKLKLANGDYLEQWHDSMSESGRTLSTADKKVDQSANFRVLQWQAKISRWLHVPQGDD